MNRLPRPRKSTSRIAQRLFGLVAVGKYASEWVIEFIALYELIAEEDGERAADEWARRELFRSLNVSTSERVLRLMKLGRTIWRLMTSS